MASEAPKRSSRQRTGTSKVRVFDENTRKEIKRKRLDSLENDNWQEERQREVDDEDDDYNPMDDGDSDSGTHTPPPDFFAVRLASIRALRCCACSDPRRRLLHTCFTPGSHLVVSRAVAARRGEGGRAEARQEEEAEEARHMERRIQVQIAPGDHR